MKISKIEKQDLLERLKNNNLSIATKLEIVFEYIDKKTNRDDVYELIEFLIDDHYSELPEEIADSIYEFRTSLIGDCASSSILRFEGDPIGDEELAKYVRSYKWKRY